MEGAGSYLGQRLWYVEPMDTRNPCQKVLPTQGHSVAHHQGTCVLVGALGTIMSQWLWRAPFVMALVICNTVRPAASG